MKFKVDENLPIEVASLLRAANHDAMTIHDQQMIGNPDPMVASVCQTEQRALLTLDLDFADIRSYPPGEYAGIVVLRPRTHSKTSVIALINLLIPILNIEPLQGKLWIVQENGLRIREN